VARGLRGLPYDRLAAEGLEMPVVRLQRRSSA